MAVLDIRKYPDKILRKKCKEVPVVDGEIRRLFDDMVMTMQATKGIGLAAPQVGLDMRLIVVDIGEGPLKLVNPKIISKKGSSILEEGCLSLPGVNIKVKRAAAVTVSALNIQNKPELIKATGIFSHVLQHEIEHLNGKLLIDYIPFYKRAFVKKRLQG